MQRKRTLDLAVGTAPGGTLGDVRLTSIFNFKNKAARAQQRLIGSPQSGSKRDYFRTV